MEPFSYQARDGLTIHGYATFPPGGAQTNCGGGLGNPWGAFSPQAMLMPYLEQVQIFNAMNFATSLTIAALVLFFALGILYATTG